MRNGAVGQLAAVPVMIPGAEEIGPVGRWPPEPLPPSVAPRLLPLRALPR